MLNRIGIPPSTLQIFAWIVGSTVPILPYTVPLWQYSLTDSPYAYLVWIPVFAFIWASSNLIRSNSYNDDAELNVLMSVPVLIVSGIVLVLGQARWPVTFIGQEMGLLIWPVWSLGLAWLLFGVGISGKILRPLLYLGLSWPPLYDNLIRYTNPPLQHLTNLCIRVVDAHTNWIRASLDYGTYLVQNGGGWTPVYITSACSGADGVLAMVILFPIVLVFMRGDTWKKVATVVFGSILAMSANILRVLAIMFALNKFGSHFALDVLHPILGVVLFLFVTVALVGTGLWLGLRFAPPQRVSHLQFARRKRSVVGAFSVVALTAMLWPAYSWVSGSELKPVPVATSDLHVLLPTFTGYQRSVIGTYDDSSTLGTGAVSLSVAYRQPGKTDIVSEMWWTNHPFALERYGIRNCLLFHGNTVLAQASYPLRKGITAAAYLIMLPPAVRGGPRDMYVDAYYTIAVRYQQNTSFIRVELARKLADQLPNGSTSVIQIEKDFLAQVPKDAFQDVTYAPDSDISQFFSFVNNYTNLVLQNNVTSA